jgi:hypothetical protein
LLDWDFHLKIQLRTKKRFEQSLTPCIGPLNPPMLGDFESDPPQNWGVRGAKSDPNSATSAIAHT